MKIAQKMLLLISAAILGMLILTISSTYQMNRVYNQSQVMPEKVIPGIKALDNVTSRFNTLNGLIWEHVTTQDNVAMQKIEQKIATAYKNLTGSLETLQSTITDDKDKALLAADQAAITAFGTLGSSVLTTSLENRKDEARNLLLAQKDKIEQVEEALQKHRDYSFSKSALAANQVFKIKNSASTTAIVTTLLITLLVAAASWYITKTLTGALGIEPDELNNIANKFAKGDFAQKINIPKDDKTSAAHAIKKLQGTLQGVIASMNYVSDEHKKGLIDTTVDHTRFEGGYAEMAKGINEMVKNHVDTNKQAMAVVKAFGEGNFETQLDAFPGDLSYINKTIEQVRSNLKNLIEDANTLSAAAVNGELSVRADESKHQGDFKKIISGVNETLDAVINPLNVAASYVDSIAKGDIPAKIEEDYHGDFNTIKNNLNLCIDAVNKMVADADRLSQAALKGELSVRADETQHQGDFNKIIAGVNATLDAVINPLNVAASYVDSISRGSIPTKITNEYYGDFNTIKNNLNSCIDAINLLVADSHKLADAASEGKIKVRADEGQHKGDFQTVIAGFNSTLDLIVDPIITVKQSTDTINTAVGEISTGNTDLSQRTEKQATDLARTVSNMKDLQETVEKNAQSSMQANKLATTASEFATKGGQAVAEVVATMEKINQSAKEIEEIISVIDGIAFQTNILALNAAVEAARAGEQGRGFSVVAGEVRNLAQRSSSAAKEIKELISQSVETTNNGTQLVENAGATMKEIVTSVDHVTAIIKEISASSQEQSQGINQVNQAINSIDDMTQQNAALVEEAAAAAESLVGQASEMKHAIETFKTDEADQTEGMKTANNVVRLSA